MLSFTQRRRGAPLQPREGTVSLTIAQAEAEVREFASEFPTPNVLRAITLAEAGTLSWFQLYDLFRSAAATAVVEVQS